MTTILHTACFLELLSDGRWEYVRRRSGNAVASIIAVTDASELLLVEQSRIPVAARVLELPAGLVGDEVVGEAVETAAARELEEETGYRPDACRVLHTAPSSPGLTPERISLVRATGLVRVGAGGGVEGEEITVHRVPLASIGTWLAERVRAGVLVDHKIHAALWWIGQECQP